MMGLAVAPILFMLRCARIWFLLALPCWLFGGTDLIDDWTPYAWALFYTFAGFGVVSLLLSLFEDSKIENARAMLEPAIDEASELIEAAAPLPIASPAPLVVVTLRPSGIPTAAEPGFETLRAPASPIGFEATSPRTSV